MYGAKRKVIVTMRVVPLNPARRTLRVDAETASKAANSGLSYLDPISATKNDEKGRANSSVENGSDGRTSARAFIPRGRNMRSARRSRGDPGSLSD
jgi:hypothetical protein